MRGVVSLLVLSVCSIAVAWELEPWKREINANLKEVLRRWENESRRIASEELGAIAPQPTTDEPIRGESELADCQSRLGHLRSEIDKIDARLAVNRKKSGAAWKRLIDKDESRKAELNAEIGQLDAMIARLTKQIAIERSASEQRSAKKRADFKKQQAEFEAELPKLLEEIQGDESRFFFLDFDDLKPGYCGRLSAFHLGSLDNISMSSRRRTLVKILTRWNSKIDIDNVERKVLRESFGFAPPGRYANVRILQVVDEMQAIACPLFVAGPESKSFWVMTPTKGMIDGEPMSLDGVFMFMGAKTYETAAGGTKTIPELIKLNLAQVVKRGAYFVEDQSGE